MSDWILRHGEKVIIAGLVIVLVILFVGLPVTMARNRQDFRDCLADGHKAYECRAMLRGRR